MYTHNINLYSGLATRNPCYLPSAARRTSVATQRTGHRHINACNGESDRRVSADEPQVTWYVPVSIRLLLKILLPSIL